MLSWVFRLAVRPPRGARLSTRIFRPCSTLWKVAGAPWLFTWLATSWYISMASASMEAASTLMAGSRTRSEKSSRLMVRSTLVKFRSTPFCVWTFSSTLVSLVSWVARAAPVRTAYWLGRRTLSVSPTLAPWRAKRSSYSREIEPTKFSFWCRPVCSPRVAGPGPPSSGRCGFPPQSRLSHHPRRPVDGAGAMRFGPLGPTPLRDSRYTFPPPSRGAGLGSVCPCALRPAGGGVRARAAFRSPPNSHRSSTRVAPRRRLSRRGGPHG